MLLNIFQKLPVHVVTEMKKYARGNYAVSERLYYKLNIGTQCAQSQ